VEGIDESFMSYDEEKKTITIFKEKIDSKKAKSEYKLNVVLEDQNGAKREITQLIDIWFKKAAFEV
jgi:hypothetical protein